MKTIMVSILTLLGCSSFQLQALTITAPTTLPISGSPLWWGTDNSNQSESQIAAIVNAPSLTLAYKKDVGGGESGLFSGSYETSFSNEPSDPSDALIDYISGPKISSSNAYLYIKDGDHYPAYYIYNLTALGWDGGDIILDDFWPKKGAISNIAIYTGSGTSVPDGGSTAILLGVGLLGIGYIARKTQFARIS